MPPPPEPVLLPLLTASPPPPSTNTDSLKPTDSELDLTAKSTKILRAPPSTVFQILSPTDAAEPCSTLGAANLITTLNHLTQQSHTASHPGVHHAIEYCLTQQLDLGGAYGRLRHLWAAPDVSVSWAAVGAERASIELARSSAFFTDDQARRTLRHPYVLGPRRLWDLYSHRVVPACFVPERRHVWAITHSWRAHMERALSPVNERQWMVPLPPGVTLEAIRDELLGMGATYCWLDVVCNRQGVKDADGVTVPDAQLAEELAADLPTMGNIYAMAGTVVRYYSGLGLPFSADGLDDTHHWFNRGWTLQEMNIKTVVGGLRAESRVVPVTGFECDRGAEPFPEFSALLRPLDSIVTATPRLAKVVKAMRPRHTRDNVDKIYGLGYLIKARTLPAYRAVEPDVTSRLEDVWWQLVYCMSDTMHGELLFLFTRPGGYKKRKWLPKWEQLMAADMVQDPNLDESVRLLPSGRAKYFGYRLAVCEIVGDEVAVTGEWEVARRFRFERDQACALQGTYTLVGNPRREYFVVCKPQVNADDLLEKVFVIHISATETARVLEWGIHRKECIFK